MDFQTRKVVPEEFSSPSSARKYKMDRTSGADSSRKKLSRNESFSVLKSEQERYQQLSDVYLDPLKVRYADSGAERALKNGDHPVVNEWVKMMEESFAMTNARRYSKEFLNFLTLLLYVSTQCLCFLTFLLQIQRFDAEIWCGDGRGIGRFCLL